MRDIIKDKLAENRELMWSMRTALEFEPNTLWFEPILTARCNHLNAEFLQEHESILHNPDPIPILVFREPYSMSQFGSGWEGVSSSIILSENPVYQEFEHERYHSLL